MTTKRIAMINKYLMGIFFATIFLFGCSFPLVDYSQKEGYKQQINQKYRLKVNCFIVDYGSSLNIFPCGEQGFPKDIDNKYIGKTFNDGKIKGSISKGTEMKIVKICYLDGFDAGGIIIFVKLIDSSISEVLSVEFIQAHFSSSPAELDSKYVEKIP